MKTKILFITTLCIISLLSVNLAYGRWPTGDPKAEKYYPVSPYAFTLNSPVRFVDPFGMDVWEINEDGSIASRTEDKTQDAFFRVNDEGKRMEGDMYSISFEYGTVKGSNEVSYQLNGQEYNITLFNIAGDDNAQQLFEVMSNNNNNIEWSHMKVGTENSGNNFVGNSHMEFADASGNYIYKNGYTIREHTHNHPSTAIISSSDKRFHTGINQNRTTPTYIYHNNGISEPRYRQYNDKGGVYSYTTYMKDGRPYIEFSPKQRMTPWQKR